MHHHEDQLLGHHSLHTHTQKDHTAQLSAETCRDQTHDSVESSLHIRGFSLQVMLNEMIRQQESFTEMVV